MTKKAVLVALGMGVLALPASPVAIASSGQCIEVPVSCRVSSQFGPRLHPVQKTWKNHNGTDFACPVGTSVSSALDGVVNFAGFHSGGGNIVKVRSGDYEFKYMHNHRNMVEIGQRVGTGDELARSGNTGKWTTGPHLHFEVWQAGRAIDPMAVSCSGGGSLDGDYAQDGGIPPTGMVHDGLDGAFWDVLSSIIESRSLNPDYARQLSTLEPERLYEEMNYLEGVGLRVAHEKAQARARIAHNRAVLNVLRAEALKRSELDASRAQALRSAVQDR